MTLDIYQADAFADNVFGGNPAAVVPLKNWLPEKTMQSIASENNLSETAFFVPKEEGYEIRWFTPKYEVRLCGHATVASSHILWTELGYEGDTLILQSKSGQLTVRKKGDVYTLNFPSSEIKEVEKLNGVEEAIQAEVYQTIRGRDDFLILVEDENTVQNLNPNFSEVAKLDARGLIVTSKGNEVDFVSRCFYPKYGVNEDPVTGSAHTLLTPFWANKLGKRKMTARQLSQRGGQLGLEYLGERTEISGKAVTYMKGQIFLK